MSSMMPVYLLIDPEEEVVDEERPASEKIKQKYFLFSVKNILINFTVTFHTSLLKISMILIL